MKKIIILTTATALLSSCGIYTKYQPAETTPDNLYGEEVAVDDTTNFGNVNWRELFTDPQLQALIEQGLQNNTDLRSAQLQIEEAEAALMSAKLAFLPSFALSPQGTISSFDGGKATKTYTLPVTASWELDIFGRLRNAKQQAKALYAQSKDYQQAVRTQLIAGIANVYYTLLMLDEQLAISQQTEESWKETVASTRALMDAGLANEAATSQMEAAYYSVQTSIPERADQPSRKQSRPVACRNSSPLRTRKAGRPAAPGRRGSRRTDANVVKPPRRACSRTFAGTGILRDQPGSCRFLSFHRTERKCRMDQLGREHDRQSGQILGFGSRIAHTAVVQQRTDHGPIPHRQSTAGGSKPVFPAGFAECRQRSQRRFGRLPDKQGQDGLVRKANPISGKGLGKYLVTDGARYDHLSGSADCPPVLVERTVVANS